ncbi:MAG: DUF2085 domain-containing protein [Candidatus Micrarchaeota archaeon]
MGSAKLTYAGYVVFFVLLVGSVFLVPLLSFSGDMGFAYSAFAATCHQKLSRSLCLFSDGASYWVADCLPQEGKFISDPDDRAIVRVESGAAVGYKMPVCSRDVGLYGAMLIGALAYPLARRLEDDSVWPAVWLVLAIVPLGLDGSVQLVSELGFLPFVYESTNAIRVATGAIAGFAASFYAIPLLVNLFRGGERMAKKAGETVPAAGPNESETGGNERTAGGEGAAAGRLMEGGASEMKKGRRREKRIN